MLKIRHNYRPFIDETYARTFAGHDMDMVITGKALPIASQWGPIGVLTGENCYTGDDPPRRLNPLNVDLLPPDDIAIKAEMIAAGVAAATAAGVKRVGPYISMDCIVLDPKPKKHFTRDAFSGFWDRWDDYAEWAGPRPETDPDQWVAIDREGIPLPGYGSPTWFAPLVRRHACPNNPAWFLWLHQVIAEAIKLGYKLVFIDNPNPVDCFCRFCREILAAILRMRTEDITTIPEPIRWAARYIRRRDQLQALRTAAREICPDFEFIGNINDPTISRWTGDGVDYVYFEYLGHPRPGETDPENRLRRVEMYRLRRHTPNIIIGRPEAGVGEHRAAAIAEFQRYGFKGGLAVTQLSQFIPDET